MLKGVYIYIIKLQLYYVIKLQFIFLSTVTRSPVFYLFSQHSVLKLLILTNLVVEKMILHYTFNLISYMSEVEHFCRTPGGAIHLDMSDSAWSWYLSCPSNKCCGGQ